MSETTFWRLPGGQNLRWLKPNPFMSIRATIPATCVTGSTMACSRQSTLARKMSSDVQAYGFHWPKWKRFHLVEHAPLTRDACTLPIPGTEFTVSLSVRYWN